MDFSRIFRLFFSSDTDRTSKDKRSRWQQFATWGIENNIQLDTTNWMALLNEYLRVVRGLSDSSIVSFDSAVRTGFRELIKNGRLRQELIAMGLPEGEADIVIGRILQAIDTDAVEVVIQPSTKQAVKLRSDEDVNNVLNDMEIREPIQLRDFTVYGLMVTTGIGVQEVSALDVGDLRYEGQPVLHVPDEPACVERLIPYGQDDWVLSVLDVWLKFAGIEEGAVFRGFYKGGRKLREERLSSRGVERLIGNYPVIVNGEPVLLKSYDLRQAYARHLFRLGEDIDTIREYLGFSTLPPVLDLLRGVIHENEPGQPYEVDLTKLEQWKNEN